MKFWTLHDYDTTTVINGYSSKRDVILAQADQAVLENRTFIRKINTKDIPISIQEELLQLDWVDDWLDILEILVEWG